MFIQEQQKVKEEHYKEAIRYMDNAKDTLRNAKKQGKYYNDRKYVKSACGTAYSGVLLALDCYLSLKGIKRPEGKKRITIDHYRNNIAKQDKKMLNTLNSVYEVLHLLGYYDGVTNADIVKSGFEDAYFIIEKINPNAS
jgi:hypothetical protein